MQVARLRRLATFDLVMITWPSGSQVPALAWTTSAGTWFLTWRPPDPPYRESLLVRGWGLRLPKVDKGLTFCVTAGSRADALGGDPLKPDVQTIDRSDGRAATRPHWAAFHERVAEVYAAARDDLPVLRASVERMRYESRVSEVEAKVAALTSELEVLRERLKHPRPW